VIYAIIIIPCCTLKSVKDTFRIEYDQRVIVKFLLNEAADARYIADRETAGRLQAGRLQAGRQAAGRLQAGCRHSLANMLINFEWFNSGLLRYDSVVKTFMMKLAPEDLLLMILMQKF
jgi:hypothetical protein